MMTKGPREGREGSRKHTGTLGHGESIPFRDPSPLIKGKGPPHNYLFSFLFFFSFYFITHVQF